MKYRLPALLLCLSALLAAPLVAAPQPQVLDDFATAGPDGQPAGWSVVAIGGEATLRHSGQTPGSMVVDYRLDTPQSVIYLLRFARLREEPWGLELTLKGDGSRHVLGAMIRDATEYELFEYRSGEPLAETGWITRTIEPKTPAAKAGDGNGKLDTLDGGGGLRLEGLTLRRGAGGAEGSLEFREIVALVDVEPVQAAMVDIVPGRFDGLFVGDEKPQAEVLVTNVGSRAQQIDVDYTVTDAEGRAAGQGRDRVELNAGQARRLPVAFSTRSPHGHYQLRAHVKAGDSERYATARVAALPATPEAGRHLGAHVVAQPGELQAWMDIALLRMLQRAGAGFARVDVAWDAVEATRGRRDWAALDRWVAASKSVGLPLVAFVHDLPRWLLSQGKGVDPAALAALVGEGAKRAGDAVIAWQVWRQPDSGRYWPPEPKPYAFRETLAAVDKAVGDGPAVVSGGLREFTPGFAGTLLLSEPFPMEYLGLEARVPRPAPPLPEGMKLPSSELAEQLEAYRAWLSASGRGYVAPWITEAGLRTSPIADTKDAQAIELARLASLAAAYGGRMTWHRAMDGETKTDRYGLIRRNLDPKPALAAFAGNAAALAGASPLASPTLPGGVRGWVLRGADGFRAVLFADSGTRSVRLQGETQATDMWGNALTGTSLSVSAEPVYVRGPGIVQSFNLAL